MRARTRPSKRPLADDKLDVLPLESLETLQGELDAHLLKRPTAYSATAFTEWLDRKNELKSKIELHQSTFARWTKN